MLVNFIETFFTFYLYFKSLSIYCQQEGPRQALNYLQKRVRMFPLNAGLRRVFLKFQLDYFRQDATYKYATANTALIALKLGHSKLQRR